MSFIPPGAETNAEYHAHPNAWGSTLINTFITEGPLVAHLRQTGALPHEESTAMAVGSALHARFDGSYDDLFAAGPQVSSRRTKTWTEAAGATDKTLLLPSEVAIVQNMEQSIRSNPFAACLLEGAQHEVGIRRAHESGLFKLQCRMDVYKPGEYIADLKTTGDLTSWAKSVVKYGYHRQAAFYQWLHEQETGDRLPFSFLVAEKARPYRCRVLDLDDAYIARGRDEVLRAIDRIVDHYRHGDWGDPGYGLLEAPGWMRQEAVA